MDVLNLLELSQLSTAGPTPVQVARDKCVYVMALTSDDRDLMELQWNSFREGSTVGFRRFVITWCLCDKNGKRLADPGSEETELNQEFVESMDLLGDNLAAATAELIFNAASKNLGLSKADLKELEGN